MSIDVISQICVYCDYPLWREMITKHRDKFEKVILYPSKQHGTLDLENFWLNNFKETWVTREPIDYGVEDWRQAETEPLIAQSNAEWLWFMEADFFVTDWDKLFKNFEEAMKTDDLIGCWSPSQFPYMHPCCLLIRRELFDKTNKDFRAHPEILGSDHFAMITRDAERLGAKITKLEDLGYKEWKDYFHLGGLTYTFQDWKGNGKDHFGMKNKQAYYVYLYQASKAKVPQSPEYLKQSKEIEKVLWQEFRSLKLENNEWNEFFKA